MKDQLSAMEHAVGELVADGLNNQEIADTLAYSRKTIDRVMRELYPAFGIDPVGGANRVKLALALRDYLDTEYLMGE